MHPITPILLAIVMALVTAGRASARQDATTPVPTVHSPQYFAVLVVELDRSATWYRTTFGLRELDRSKADDGSWEIVNLINDQLLVELIRDDRARPAARPMGYFKVGFFVPDVQAVAEALTRATGERPRVVEASRQGLRILQLRDPDGNVVQLHSRLVP